MSIRPMLSQEQLDRIDAECRASNFPSDRQVSPFAKPLLQEPPLPDLAKPIRQSRAFLRLGVKPYFVALDVLACTLIAMLVHPPVGPYLIGAGITLGCLGFTRLYRSRRTLSLLDDMPFVFGAVVVGQVVVMAVTAAASTATESPTSLFAGAALLLALTLSRAIAYAATRRARSAGYLRDLALVIGAGQVGKRLTQILQEHREYGLDPVGFVDSNPRIDFPSELPAPLLGDYSDLASVIADFNVSYVVVAFGHVRDAELVEILRTCDRLECEIYFVPRLFELTHTTRGMDHVWGVPLVRVRRAPYRSFSWRLKRVLDIVFSCTALALLSPLILACALAVRLEGGPGVIFRQERVGLDGRRFELLKFRSLRPVDDTESMTWNISHDVRLGSVGRFLRRSSLDEIPQLWNVLMGRMSLVGPRPERVHFVNQFAQNIPRYTARHRVPAGLTGWAQVHGLRGDTSIEDRAIFDNDYIENWSLWGDIKIMIRTLEQLVRRTGA